MAVENKEVGFFENPFKWAFAKGRAKWTVIILGGLALVLAAS